MTVGASLTCSRTVARRAEPLLGKFFFLGHGGSEDVGIAGGQDRLNPLQRLIGCGCNMNRRIDEYIREAGLEIAALDRFRMPRAPRLLGEMFRGVALSRKSGV